MKLYMKVTRDEYELPIAVAESKKELAQMLKIRRYDVYNGFERAKKGANGTYKEVEVEDDDWVSIYEDVPQKDPNMERCSIYCDALLTDGTIIHDAFCTLDDEEWFDRHGNKLRNVTAWRSLWNS